MARAKYNVEYYYSVVGMTEDMVGFLEVMEYVFPGYFKGAPELYKIIGKITVSYSRSLNIKATYFISAIRWSFQYIIVN